MSRKLTELEALLQQYEDASYETGEWASDDEEIPEEFQLKLQTAKDNLYKYLKKHLGQGLPYFGD